MSSEDLIKALQRLQGVMSSEGFSSTRSWCHLLEGGESPKLQLLSGKVQSQGRLQKQEAGHVEQLAKLEHQIAQQQTMLHAVR